ncbi:hypothetical protein HDU76_003333, partial [Blyttiomyces sp. JEL0837]
MPFPDATSNATPHNPFQSPSTSSPDTDIQLYNTSSLINTSSSSTTSTASSSTTASWSSWMSPKAPPTSPIMFGSNSSLSSSFASTQPKVVSIRNLDDATNVNVSPVSSYTASPTTTPTPTSPIEPSSLSSAISQSQTLHQEISLSRAHTVSHSYAQQNRPPSLTSTSTANTLPRLTKAYPLNKEERRLFARPVTMSTIEVQRSISLQSKTATLSFSPTSGGDESVGSGNAKLKRNQTVMDAPPRAQSRGVGPVAPPRASSVNVSPTASLLRREFVAVGSGSGDIVDDSKLALNNSGNDASGVRGVETESRQPTSERGFRRLSGGGLARKFSFENLSVLGSSGSTSGSEVVSRRELPDGEVVPLLTVTPTSANDDSLQIMQVSSITPQSPSPVTGSGGNTVKSTASKIFSVFKNGGSVIGSGGFSSSTTASNSTNTNTNTSTTPTVFVSRSLSTAATPESVLTDSTTLVSGSGMSSNNSLSSLSSQQSSSQSQSQQLQQQQQNSIGVLGFSSTFRLRRKPKQMNVVIDDQPTIININSSEQQQHYQAGLTPTINSNDTSPSSSGTSNVNTPTVGNVNAALFGPRNSSLVALMDYYVPGDEDGGSVIDDNGGVVGDDREIGDEVKSRIECVDDDDDDDGEGEGEVEGRDAIDGSDISGVNVVENESRIGKRKTSWGASRSGRGQGNGDTTTTTVTTTTTTTTTITKSKSTKVSIRKGRSLSRERSGNSVRELSPSSKINAANAMSSSASNALPLGNGIFVDVATGHLVFFAGGVSPNVGRLGRTKSFVDLVGNSGGNVGASVGLGIGFGGTGAGTGGNGGKSYGNNNVSFVFDSNSMSPNMPGSGLSGTTTSSTTQSASLAQRRSAFRAKMKSWSVFAGISNLNGGGNTSATGDFVFNNDVKLKPPVMVPSQSAGAAAGFKSGGGGGYLKWPTGYNAGGGAGNEMSGSYQNSKEGVYGGASNLSPLLMGGGQGGGVATPISRRSRLVFFEEDGSVRAIDGGEQQQQQQLKEKMDGKGGKKLKKGGSGKSDGGTGSGVLRIVNGGDEDFEDSEKVDGSETALQEVDDGDEFLAFIARGNVVASPTSTLNLTASGSDMRLASFASSVSDINSLIAGSNVEPSTTSVNRQSRMNRQETYPLRSSSPPPKVLSPPGSPRLRRPMSLDPGAFLRMVNGNGNGNGSSVGSGCGVFIEEGGNVNSGGKKPTPGSPMLLGRRLTNRLSWASLSNILVTATPSPPSSPVVGNAGSASGIMKSPVKNADKSPKSYPPIFTQSPLPIGYFDPLAGAKVISSVSIAPTPLSVNTLMSPTTPTINLSPNLTSPSTSSAWLLRKPSNPSTASSSMLKTSMSTPNLGLMVSGSKNGIHSSRDDDDGEGGVRRVQSGVGVRSMFAEWTSKRQSVGSNAGSELDGGFDAGEVVRSRRGSSPALPPLPTDDEDENDNDGGVGLVPVDDGSVAPPSTPLVVPRSLLSSHLNSPGGSGSSNSVSFKTSEPDGRPHISRIGDSLRVPAGPRGSVTLGRPSILMRRAIGSSVVDTVGGFDPEGRVSPVSPVSPGNSSRVQFDPMAKGASVNVLSSSYGDGGSGMIEENQVGSKWGQKLQDSLSRVRNFTRRASSGDLFKKARMHGMGGLDNASRGRSDSAGASAAGSVDSWESGPNSSSGYDSRGSPVGNGDGSAVGFGEVVEGDAWGEEVVLQKRNTQYRMGEFGFFKRRGNWGSSYSSKENDESSNVSGAANIGPMGQVLPMPLVQTPRPRFPIEDDDEEFESETMSRRSGATGLYSQFSARRDTMVSAYSVRRKRTVSSESSETASTGQSVRSFADSIRPPQSLTWSSKNRASGSWDIPTGSRGQQRKHWDTGSVGELSKSHPLEGHFGGGEFGGDAEMDDAVSDVEWESGDEEDFQCVDGADRER